MLISSGYSFKNGILMVAAKIKAAAAPSGFKSHVRQRTEILAPAVHENLCRHSYDERTFIWFP